jgi:DNA-binding MarR family transcriptional regulator
MSAATSLVMDRTTRGRNILPLEREGLVEIVPGEVDRRSKIVRLTEAGAARLRAAGAGWTQAQQKFEAAVGRRRASQLRALLHDVTETELPQAPAAEQRSIKSQTCQRVSGENRLRCGRQ